MKIFAKTNSGKIFTLEVEPSNTIEDVKTKIQDIDGTPPGKQELYYGGKKLEDKKTLTDYNIEKDATLALTYKIRC